MNIQEFDFKVDLMQALLWQYNEAVGLQSIIQSKQDWYDINQQTFWVNWIRDIFDLRTANQFGLTIWSIILDIPIIVQATPPDPGDIPFGMDDTDGNFEHSNFYPDAFQAQQLSIEQARIVLQLRYNQLVSDGSVIHTNEVLDRFFGADGGAYVVDNLDMTINYVFRFTPSSELTYIFNNYDILPRPAGVEMQGISVIPVKPFGFDIFNNNFDNGNFRS